MRRIALALAVIAAVPIASPAYADIVVITGVNNLDTESVSFADQVASSIIYGSAGGQTNNFSVTGTTVSLSNLLVATSGEVEGSGSDLTSITLSQIGGDAFSRIVFNIDAAVSGTVGIHVLEPDNTFFDDDFTVDDNGQNFFTITAINGQSIESVTVTGLSGTTLTGVENVRFGPVAVSGVPEPATWAMMLLGFAGVGGALRRRGRAVALA